MENFPRVYLSHMISVFFLWSNQTVIHVFFLCFTILYFTLVFFYPAIQRALKL